MKRKSEIEIAYRSYDFLIKKFNTVVNIVKYTKITKSTLYKWKNGETAPSAYYLQLFVQLGADPKYLLTGRKGDVE